MNAETKLVKHLPCNLLQFCWISGEMWTMCCACDLDDVWYLLC